MEVIGDGVYCRFDQCNGTTNEHVSAQRVDHRKCHRKMDDCKTHGFRHYLPYLSNRSFTSYAVNYGPCRTIEEIVYWNKSDRKKLYILIFTLQRWACWQGYLGHQCFEKCRPMTHLDILSFIFSLPISLTWCRHNHERFCWWWLLSFITIELGYQDFINKQLHVLSVIGYTHSLNQSGYAINRKC